MPRTSCVACLITPSTVQSSKGFAVRKWCATRRSLGQCARGLASFSTAAKMDHPSAAGRPAERLLPLLPSIWLPAAGPEQYGVIAAIHLLVEAIADDAAASRFDEHFGERWAQTRRHSHKNERPRALFPSCRTVETHWEARGHGINKVEFAGDGWIGGQRNPDQKVCGGFYPIAGPRGAR